MEKKYDIPDWVTPQTYDANKGYARKTYQRIPDWVNATYDRNHYGVLPRLQVIREQLGKCWGSIGRMLGLLGICLLLCFGIQ